MWRTLPRCPLCALCMGMSCVSMRSLFKKPISTPIGVECMQALCEHVYRDNSHLSHLNEQQIARATMQQTTRPCLFRSRCPRSAHSLQVRAHLGWMFGSMYGQACMEVVLLAESIPMDVHPLVHVLS